MPLYCCLFHTFRQTENSDWGAEGLKGSTRWVHWSHMAADIFSNTDHFSILKWVEFWYIGIMEHTWFIIMMPHWKNGPMFGTRVCSINLHCFVPISSCSSKLVSWFGSRGGALIVYMCNQPRTLVWFRFQKNCFSLVCDWLRHYWCYYRLYDWLQFWSVCASHQVSQREVHR